MTCRRSRLPERRRPARRASERGDDRGTAAASESPRHVRLGKTSGEASAGGRASRPWAPRYARHGPHRPTEDRPRTGPDRSEGDEDADDEAAAPSPQVGRVAGGVGSGRAGVGSWGRSERHGERFGDGEVEGEGAAAARAAAKAASPSAARAACSAASRAARSVAAEGAAEALGQPVGGAEQPRRPLRLPDGGGDGGQSDRGRRRSRAVPSSCQTTAAAEVRRSPRRGRRGCGRGRRGARARRPPASAGRCSASPARATPRARPASPRWRLARQVDLGEDGQTIADGVATARAPPRDRASPVVVLVGGHDLRRGCRGPAWRAGRRSRGRQRGLLSTAAARAIVAAGTRPADRQCSALGRRRSPARRRPRRPGRRGRPRERPLEPGATLRDRSPGGPEATATRPAAGSHRRRRPRSPGERCAQVAVVGLQPVQPPAVCPREQLGLARSASARYQAAWRRRIASASPLAVQPLQRVLADRLQHAEARFAVPVGAERLGRSEAVVDQRREEIEQSGSQSRRAGRPTRRLPTDLGRRRAVKPPTKTASRRNSACSLGRAGRGSRRSRRAASAAGLARRAARRSAAAAAAPAAQQLGRRQQLDPRRGQLDRQRQPVQPAADRGHRRRRSSAVRAKSGRTSAARSTNSRTAATPASPATGEPGRRTVPARQAPPAAGPRISRSPRSRSRTRLVASTRSPAHAGQQLRHERRRRQQVLEVVEDEQQRRWRRSARRQRRGRRPPGDLPRPHHAGDRRRHQVRHALGAVAERGQLDPGHPVGEGVDQLAGRRQRQPRLADPAGAGQRQQPRPPPGGRRAAAPRRPPPPPAPARPAGSAAPAAAAAAGSGAAAGSAAAGRAVPRARPARAGRPRPTRRGPPRPARGRRPAAAASPAAGWPAAPAPGRRRRGR